MKEEREILRKYKIFEKEITNCALGISLDPNLFVFYYLSPHQPLEPEDAIILEKLIRKRAQKIKKLLKSNLL